MADTLDRVALLHHELPIELEKQGLMLPRSILKNISELNGFENLPQLETVLGEIAKERMSSIGSAWTWTGRNESTALYRSSLLDNLSRSWTLITKVDESIFHKDSYRYIDPRLSAYFSLPYVNAARWIRINDVNDSLYEADGLTAEQLLFGGNEVPGGAEAIKVFRNSISDFCQSVGAKDTITSSQQKFNLRVKLRQLDGGYSFNLDVECYKYKRKVAIDCVLSISTDKVTGEETPAIYIPVSELLFPHSSRYFHDSASGIHPAIAVASIKPIIRILMR